MISVLTTINKPTKAVEELAKRSELIVIGDMKTPDDWHYEGVQYINTQQQQQSEFSLRHYLKFNHYSRKNIGYLLAIKNGADVIYDTDDDNIPNENWKIREINCETYFIESRGWTNVYRQFTEIEIWPRGFSLKHINDLSFVPSEKTISLGLIQQGVSDGAPDVDAIYRLTKKETNTKIIRKRSVVLNSGTWCPFNSQSTWWFSEAYPLLYLPINVSFRMTDIWRSFVAQRCLWEMGYGVTFHSPAEVYQERNEHDLLKDFEQEIDGYLKNDLIVETLTNLKLKQGKENLCDNMLACYQSLADINILPEMEMRSVNAWLKDINEIWKP